MEIGNLIKPTEKSNFILHCGTSQYDKAVVISTDPFIITSEESDMRWESTVQSSDFEVVGNVSEEVLNKCLNRI